MTPQVRLDADSAQMEKLAELSTGVHPSAVIVIGLGTAGLLDRIAERLPTTNVLALEPSPAVAAGIAALPGVSSRVEQGRLMLLTGPDYAGATEAWRLFSTVNGMPPIFLDPVLEQQRPEDMARAKLAAAKVVLGAKENNAARRQFAGPYLLNTLTNLPVIASEGNAAALVDAFKGVPAIVVAAGPSLDDTVAAVADLAKRALVIAVDTAVRPLLAAGARPHLVVSVDPSAVNARHLNDLPDPNGMWLVAEGSLHPTVFPQFEGRTFVFKVSNHHPWPWLAEIQADRGQLHAWGSVLTTAFDLACQAGCNPIVFVGADLAYTDNQLYCRNTIYERDWRHLETAKARAEFFELAYFATRPTCVEPDVHGAPVRSAARFLQFRDWLVARAARASDRQIVNATGAGILHGPPIAQADLVSATAGWPELAPRSVIGDRLIAAWTGGADRGARRRVRRGLRDVQQRRAGIGTLDSWIEFGRDTVSPDRIGERIDFALKSLSDTACGWTASRTGDLARLMRRHDDDEAAMTRIQTLERERDEALAARDAAVAERDRALKERELAINEQAEAAAAAFLGPYPTWRTNRLRFLMDAWRDCPFRGATLLELGCGHGDIGAFFLSLGADVTFSDAREEHLAVVQSRYPGAVTVLHDSNRPLPQPPSGRYDFVIHMGLLYHLHPDAVASSIRNACAVARHVVLETEVCDSSDPTLVVETRESGFDQAFDGIGARPSSAFVERVLNECDVRWRRHDDSRLNTDLHIYDWQARDNGRFFEPNAARADASAEQKGIRRFYTIEAE
jgi:2-polyprenyl-3-methyl-5-hydroxy-6-metoxy-1,4-benzoquinol methylase